MTKRIEEYETLIQKYNALQRLIDEEFLEAIDELDSAISHMESTTNYIRAQKVIRSKINCWLHEYGDMYEFNQKCSRCVTLANKIECLTNELMALDFHAQCISQKTKKMLKKAQKINVQLSKLKKEYQCCIESNPPHSSPHNE